MSARPVRRAAGTRGAPDSRASVLVDSGVLIALFDRLDTHHAVATAWMSAQRGSLLTVAPVLSETAFFLPSHLRPALARLVAREVIHVQGPDLAGYARI